MPSSHHRIQQETIERLGPKPNTPLERLRHTLAVHAETPGDQVVVEATDGIYGDGVRTGLTMDDLRALAAQIKERPAKKPSKAQMTVLSLVNSGRVYRWERAASSYFTAPDGSRIAKATVSALVKSGWAQYGDLEGIRRPLLITDAGRAQLPH
ncbi:hypothetical protein ACIG3E_33400 [Streptomyces sp. NPDC053474]|uniref:hypothetical protein n=1 Tax=Streptomyces sp. NPDC053474 TaxID=3365704 RepID=UPI0037D19FC4